MFLFTLRSRQVLQNSRGHGRSVVNMDGCHLPRSYSLPTEPLWARIYQRSFGIERLDEISELETKQYISILWNSLSVSSPCDIPKFLQSLSGQPPVSLG